MDNSIIYIPEQTAEHNTMQEENSVLIEETEQKQDSVNKPTPEEQIITTSIVAECWRSEATTKAKEKQSQTNVIKRNIKRKKY